MGLERILNRYEGYLRAMKEAVSKKAKRKLEWACEGVVGSFSFTYSWMLLTYPGSVSGTPCGGFLVFLTRIPQDM